MVFNIKNVLRVTIVPLLVHFLCGCTVGLQAIRPSGEKLSQYEGAEVLDQLQKKDLAVETYQALARNVNHSADSRLGFRQSIQFIKPETIRIESYPTQGFYALNVLTVSDGVFNLHDLASREDRAGEISRATMREMLRIPLEPSEMTSLYHGAVRLDATTREEAEVFKDSALNLIYITAPNPRRIWVVDAANLHLQRFAVDNPYRELPSVILELGDYQMIDTFEVPTLLKINFLEVDEEIEQKLSNIQVNLPLKKEQLLR